MKINKFFIHKKIINAINNDDVEKFSKLTENNYAGKNYHFGNKKNDNYLSYALKYKKKKIVKYLLKTSSHLLPNNFQAYTSDLEIKNLLRKCFIKQLITAYILNNHDLIKICSDKLNEIKEEEISNIIKKLFNHNENITLNVSESYIWIFNIIFKLYVQNLEKWRETLLVYHAINEDREIQNFINILTNLGKLYVYNKKPLDVTDKFLENCHKNIGIILHFFLNNIQDEIDIIQYATQSAENIPALYVIIDSLMIEPQENDKYIIAEMLITITSNNLSIEELYYKNIHILQYINNITEKLSNIEIFDELIKQQIFEAVILNDNFRNDHPMILPNNLEEFIFKKAKKIIDYLVEQNIPLLPPRNLEQNLHLININYEKFCEHKELIEECLYIIVQNIKNEAHSNNHNKNFAKFCGNTKLFDTDFLDEKDTNSVYYLINNVLNKEENIVTYEELPEYAKTYQEREIHKKVEMLKNTKSFSEELADWRDNMDKNNKTINL